MSKNEYEAFDLTKEFQDEIEPQLRKIFDRCAELNMPIQVNVCYGADDNGAAMGYRCLSGGLLPDGRTPSTFYESLAAIQSNGAKCNCESCSAQKTDGTLPC